MRAPLAVRIDDGFGSRMVSKHVDGLRFRKTAPGGHHSASMTINLPPGLFPKLGPADSLFIYDGRNGRPIWDGYTDNPGGQDGPEGQGFDLSAMGGISRATDESRALVYLDTDLQNWYRSGGSPSSNTTVADDPTASVTEDGLLMQFNPGQTITTGSTAPMAYAALRTADMEFGAMWLRQLDGKTDANYDVEIVWSPAAGTRTFGTYNSNDSGFAMYVGDASSPPAGQDLIRLRLRRAAGGATTVADDNTWVFFYQIRVLGRRMDRDGTLLTGIADHVTTNYVLASWIAEDLLGRVLTFCDPTTATIDTSTAQIDQLAYLDGATAAQVFEDLALSEPDFYWGIGERSFSSGKHRFWFRQWPTSVRYEISTRDGYSAPGGDIELCNRIAVYWTDAKGKKQTTIRTSSVEELGGAPGDLGARTRDAESVTLPEGRGSLANAQRIGDEILASKAAASKAATAIVSRPIKDHLTGQMVMPWEIEPGYLVRVRETGDLLRLTEMEYVDDDCSATLTLGEPALTADQRIARLVNKR